MFRPKCTVNGVKSKGRMCSQIIVNGKLCGYDGDCVYKEGHKTNQYTLGYKAALDAAAKVCRELPLSVIEDGILRRTLPTDCEAAIAALPVPEVQWRYLTDKEIDEVINKMEPLSIVGDRAFARAVIAKFNEVNK